MIIYRFFTVLIRIGIRVYFRKIFFFNDEVVSLDKPVLIACNHPTAFIEPLLIGMTLKKPIYYLVRADVFKDGIVKFFTDAFHMIPIYRFVDGYSNLKNNKDIFTMLYKKLSDGNVIVVFAEGNTKQEKRLRPIKKGTARMAFGAYEQHGDQDIVIIPTGVNYTYPNEFRKEVMLEFGEPIKLADYMDVYNEHPNRAIMQVTKELQKRMKKYVICIDDKADENYVEQQFILHRNNRRESILPVTKRTRKELAKEWQIASAVNQMEEGQKQIEKTKTQKYFDQLSNHKLVDRSILKGNTKFTIFGAIIAIIGFFPYLIGMLFSAIPILITLAFIKKKIKSLEFEAPIRFVMGTLLYLVYWLILVGIGFAIGNYYVTLFLIFLPAITYLSFLYGEHVQAWNEDRRYVFAKKEVKSELKEMRKRVILKTDAILTNDHSESN